MKVKNAKGKWKTIDNKNKKDKKEILSEIDKVKTVADMRKLLKKIVKEGVING